MSVQPEPSEQAIEVIVMWGDANVLDVKHLSPARTYTVGESVDDKGRINTDFMLGAASLGGREVLPLFVVEDDRVKLSITPTMRGCVEVAGESVTIDALREGRALVTSTEIHGVSQIELAASAGAELCLGELRFIVRRVDSMPKLITHNPKIDWQSYGWVAASIAFHAFFLVAFYFLPPSAMARNMELMHLDRRYIDYVMEAPETEPLDLPDTTADDAASGDDGKAHADDSGQMGKPSEKKTKNHYAVAGDAKPQDRVLARQAAQDVAKTGGLIGILKSVSGSWDSPTSPYGAEQALGSDAMSALGALTGEAPGANFGFGGLGPRGTGRGGGGDGNGTVGVGDMGTIGGMGGPGDHGPGGYGSTQGKLRGHEGRVPTLKIGPTEVKGGLSKEAIRREIHRHLAEIRFCYESELNTRPDLEGRVAVKFLIKTDGAVQLANITQSTLGSARAEACITNAIARWNFPAAPGVSIVSYPFMLSRAAE